MVVQINFAQSQSDFDNARRLFIEYAELWDSAYVFKVLMRNWKIFLENTQPLMAASCWPGMSWFVQAVWACVP